MGICKDGLPKGGPFVGRPQPMELISPQPPGWAAQGRSALKYSSPPTVSAALDWIARSAGLDCPQPRSGGASRMGCPRAVRTCCTVACD
jgi:hypothetical protein